MAFTEAQLKNLQAKLNSKYVRTRRAHDTTLAYVEGWHVVAEANRQALNPPIGIEEPDANGEYVVLHSRRVLAYSPTDDLAHRYYDGENTRQQTWVKDLPRLDQGKFQ